jgi:dihydroorotate dehydrogenase electron transfer subunit
MAGRAFAGQIVSVDTLPGDASLLTVVAPPGIAAQAKPGQFVQVLCRDRWSYDPYLRQSYFLFAASPEDETLSIAVHTGNRGGRWLANRQPGNFLDVSGPSGNGFTIAPAA